MRKLTLHKPALDDYVDVEKDLNENYRKIEEWANSSGTELDNKFDDGGVSTDYDTAKKMEDKIKFLATQIEKTPIGTILPFASGTIPKDYLLCDGREITKNDYSELYDILPFGGYIDEKVFRGLAKNEVPNMTGPTLNGYTITESSVFSATFPGWKAFDSVISGDNGGWASLTGQKEGWVQIQYPNKRALSSFTIKTRTYDPGSKLEKISVYGVTTTSEEELFTENLSRAFTTNEKREFKVNFNKKTYDKFKIKVSAPNDQYCAIDEIELFTVDITQFPNHKQETTKKYLPDLRGQFLRGIKDRRKLLDWENEDIKKHNHKVPLAYPPESSVTNTLKEYTEVREKKTIFQTLMLDDNVNDNVYGRPIAKETYEGNETRPSNIGVNYIIKAKNGINDNSIPAYIESLLNDLNNLKNNLGQHIKDNSISSSKLKTDSDADKIKLANLAEEVVNSMSKLTKDSVVREYIADGAVNASKIDNSMFHKEYLVNIKSTRGISFKINTLSLKSGDKIEVIWFAKEKKNNDLTFYHGSGLFHKSLTSVTEIKGIFKHYLSFNLETNFNLAGISIGNGGSGSTVSFNGAYYDFTIKVNGKNIDFTFGNTSEEISLVNVCEKSAIDYETALNLVNSKKTVLSEFSDEDKMLILGKATDEYEVCIEKLKSTQNFIKNKIAIPNIRLKAGKYKILPYAINRNFIIYAFPTARGGKILQKFELNKITSEGIEIILTNDSYVGIQEKDNSGNGAYWFGVGTTYKTNFFSTTTTHEVEEVLLVNEGDGAISPRDSYTCPLQFELTKISSLTTNSNSQEIEDIKKIYTDKLNNIASFDINNIPSENKQILYRIEDLKDILYNDDFIYSKNINNVMTDSSIFIHTPYQAIDEFTYRVKFKLNNINSKFGITAYKGEFENGAWMIDTTTKTLNFINAVSPTFVQNLNLDYQFEDRIGYSDFPTILNIEGIEFQENNIYILEIVRSGLIMILNIYDIKNDKTFSKKIPNSRFHGGKGVFVQEGEIEIVYVEEKTPLINGAKAIFIGDSITEGLSMGTNDISKRWCSLLRDNYFKGNALCSGMGWGTTTNVLDVLNGIKSYCDYIKYYFVMIGTNQSAANGVGFEKWAKGIVVIYDKIKKELGGIPIIVCPPLRKNTDSKILQMRDFILEKGWDTIRMDIATSTGDGITFDNSLSTDGTHFNVNGNQKMYERTLIDLKRIM